MFSREYRFNIDQHWQNEKGVWSFQIINRLCLHWIDFRKIGKFWKADSIQFCYSEQHLVLDCKASIQAPLTAAHCWINLPHFPSLWVCSPTPFHLKFLVGVWRRPKPISALFLPCHSNWLRASTRSNQSMKIPCTQEGSFRWLLNW